MTPSLQEAIEEIQDGLSPFSHLAVVVGLKAALIEVDEVDVTPEMAEFLDRVEELTIEYISQLPLGH
ncbi:hypothetical protein [Mycobacterium paragordonae]|uniref:Uncharacterized protein n=1 Tax=Mycobacterium paragordonae TaxID=1389713 RepID=A0AAJ1RZK7_9MYCO|nr:hypothetical protein [Mycobacterium paragordonae]MDP7733690.1 hypothetical protein [Mycobacterium paragordonae]